MPVAGLRRDFNIASNKRVLFVLRPSSALSDEEAAVLRILLNAERLDLTPDYEPPKGTPTALTPLGELYLPLEGLIDLDAERQRLGKEIAKMEAELVTVRKKLGNAEFRRQRAGRSRRLSIGSGKRISRSVSRNSSGCVTR